MTSIRAQLTEIQSKFDALTEELLPDVRRYLKEGLGLNRTNMVEASDIRISHSQWAGYAVTVNHENFTDGYSESVEIPFGYFDDVENTIASMIADRNLAKEEKERRDLTERRNFLEGELKRANQDLEKLNVKA